MSSRAVMEPAFAKLNLLLSVGEAMPAGQPQAGYHPICSWFACIALHDDVHVERCASGASTYAVRWANDAPRTRVIDWPLDKDLAVRAHRALEAHVGAALPVRMTLTKRIPVGGGLGGGSSDAASCLRAVRAAHDLDIDDDTLATLGAGLGSDVPYFLRSRDATDADQPPTPAVVRGLGDHIEPVARVAGDIVLVVPGFACATAQVYQAYDALLADELRSYRLDRAVMGVQGRERSTGPREQLVRGRVDRMTSKGRIDSDQLFNDLAKPAYVVEPRLGQLVTALSNATRSSAHVTGSGSCVFLAPPPGRTAWVVERVQRTCAALGATPEFGGVPVVVVTQLAQGLAGAG